jgi:hypothetical protein
MLQDDIDWRDKDLRNLTIDEVKEFVNKDSSFQKSVLGYAQLNCPLAYEEYFKTRNPNMDISHYFNKLYGWDTDFKYTPDGLKEFFNQREKQLNNK